MRRALTRGCPGTPTCCTRCCTSPSTARAAPLDGPLTACATPISPTPSMPRCPLPTVPQSCLQARAIAVCIMKVPSRFLAKHAMMQCFSKEFKLSWSLAGGFRAWGQGNVPNRTSLAVNHGGIDREAATNALPYTHGEAYIQVSLGMWIPGVATARTFPGDTVQM